MLNGRYTEWLVCLKVSATKKRVEGRGRLIYSLRQHCLDWSISHFFILANALCGRIVAAMYGIQLQGLNPRRDGNKVPLSGL